MDLPDRTLQQLWYTPKSYSSILLDLGLLHSRLTTVAAVVFRRESLLQGFQQFLVVHAIRLS